MSPSVSRSLLVPVLALFGVLTATEPSLAADFYYVKVGGNDNLDGESETTAWASIQKACTVGPGKTVFFLDGVYSGTITGCSGTAGNPIKFQAQNPRGAILDGGRTISNAVALDGESYVEIRDFEIRNYAAHAIILQEGREYGYGFKVIGNYIHHCGDYITWAGKPTSARGIQASSVQDTVIEGNEITYLDAEAIRLNGNFLATSHTGTLSTAAYNAGTDTTTITSAQAMFTAEDVGDWLEVVHSQDTYTYLITGVNGTTECVVSGNASERQADDVLTVMIDGYCTNVEIRNNKIHHTGKDAITGGGRNVVIEFNHLYDNCLTPNHQDALEISACEGVPDPANFEPGVIVRYNVIGDHTQLVYGSVPDDRNRDFTGLYVYGNVFYNSLYWKVYGGACEAVKIRNGPDVAVSHIEVHSNTFLFHGKKPIEMYGGSSLHHVRIYNNIFNACRGGGSWWAHVRLG